ncbi:MAG TPA: ABC transporter ATP-binding protein [Blastocatellia bacterium]|nr:ABC transporter ATP-binding protein [Blastocatellia bacterium]HMV84919.1 ABC transporter ATP-binding protein [Blastocatellia bacterium]HMX27467.1 ABC transporter ATP-binding protein [Blastocatellia bacterium]HMZ22331.1 ABC transporter ATP-binding protein [Blastocatellia bacterium]HNG33207.1 ABC transporter ATP-binding protein [Blastocatellia bacterium]
MNTTNIIEMRGITKQFGSVVANKSINLNIPANTIHSIVGENGAGKSTIMKILYGFYTADEGEIRIDGKQREIRNPHDAIALGLGMVHQHFMLVPPMTVLENIVLGAEPGNAAKIDFKQAEARINQLSKDFGFNIDPHKRIEQLSVGQQQRVEVLKALYRGARILILDEPTAVLTPQEVEEFFKILRSMREQGKTIIIITHKLNEVLALSDNVTVMRDGQVVGETPTSQTSAAELARMMVGRDVLLRVEKPAAKPKNVVLSVNNLSAGAKLNGVTFDVRAGEIVGIAGVEGNGQTELIEVLAGLHHASAGSCALDGKEITKLPAKQIKELGIAHIPEDRHRRGLLLEFNLADNTILGTQYRKPPVTTAGLLDEKAVTEKANRLIRDFDVRPPNAALPARALSGGNQQKLIIGREFDLHPKLLLVSQPTRGVDIGAIEFIHRKLVELRDAGAAVLLVSAELEEVLSLSDRVLVMYQGRIVGEVDPGKVEQEEIGLMMTGGKRR